MVDNASFFVLLSGITIILALQLTILTAFKNKLERIEQRLLVLEDILGIDVVTWTTLQKPYQSSQVVQNEAFPLIETRTYFDTPLTIPFQNDRATLLLFLDTKCSACYNFLTNLIKYLDTLEDFNTFPENIIIFAERIVFPNIIEHQSDDFYLYQCIDDGTLRKKLDIQQTPFICHLDQKGNVSFAGKITALDDLVDALK